MATHKFYDRNAAYSADEANHIASDVAVTLSTIDSIPRNDDVG